MNLIELDSEIEEIFLGAWGADLWSYYEPLEDFSIILAQIGGGLIIE